MPRRAKAAVYAAILLASNFLSLNRERITSAFRPAHPAKNQIFDFSKRGDIYAGVAVSNHLMSDDDDKNCGFAKTFVYDAECRHIWTEKKMLPSYCVFVFELLPPPTTE